MCEGTFLAERISAIAACTAAAAAAAASAAAMLPTCNNQQQVSSTALLQDLLKQTRTNKNDSHTLAWLPVTTQQQVRMLQLQLRLRKLPKIALPERRSCTTAADSTAAAWHICCAALLPCCCPAAAAAAALLLRCPAAAAAAAAAPQLHPDSQDYRTGTMSSICRSKQASKQAASKHESGT
jgi:uncharacterized protein YfaS (alpha-2-macroglobulin family)